MTTERATQLFDTLNRCDREQQRMVTEALRGVLTDVRRHGEYSQASWLIAGLLDGQVPVREESKRRAGQRISEKRQAA